jgi:hypothetical protein
MTVGATVLAGARRILDVAESQCAQEFMEPGVKSVTVVDRLKACLESTPQFFVAWFHT